MRTIHLRERSRKLVLLSPEDVGYLLAHHESRLDVVPTGERNRYLLTPRGIVGVILTPRCRLVLHPKIPLRNLWMCLDEPTDSDVFGDRTETTQRVSFLDFLVEMLVRRLSQIGRVGIHRDYRERRSVTPYLQGRIDVPEQLRHASNPNRLLHCTHDEFTADIPCNQIPRSLAESLMPSAVLDTKTRDRLRQALEPFRDVGLVPLDRVDWPVLRVPDSYRSLFSVCQWLHEGLAPTTTAGAVPAPTFLLEMERLFERYLTRGFLDVSADSPALEIEVQPHCVVVPARPKHPTLTMCPDILVSKGGQRHIVDAKWKRLARTPLVTDDVYQMLAYCTALAVPRATLVYPGKRNRVWRYPLPDASVELCIRTLRVVGTPSNCSESLQALVEQICADRK